MNLLFQRRQLGEGRTNCRHKIVLDYISRCNTLSNNGKKLLNYFDIHDYQYHAFIWVSEPVNVCGSFAMLRGGEHSFVNRLSAISGNLRNYTQKPVSGEQIIVFRFTPLIYLQIIK